MNTLTRFYKICASLFLIWTLLFIYSIQREISAIKQETISLAKREAITTFNKDQSVRLWSTQHGGVYVPISDKTPPNKFLSHIPDRDVITQSGKKLTLMNPAYMIRQIMEDYEKFYGPKGRITSLKFLNPENKPDAWESKALKVFEESGRKEFYEIVGNDLEAYLRLIRPMIVKEGCLKCHGFQGYKVGDIRGGVGVKLSLAPYLILERKKIREIVVTQILVWGVGTIALFMFTFWGRSKVNEQIIAQEKLISSNRQLQEALNEVKTLQGIIPICSYCKKIRDDEGFWNQLEAYLHSHAEVEFSHGACPDCYKKQMEEMEQQ
ncbi:MAG: DUF3365 domain-containing protein [Desulfobulbaceae bacterium]|nr:DUF3365 domain-containing protein [Desulfobulbaceae bacterium]